MPAETHTTHEGIDRRDVLELIESFIGPGDDDLRSDIPLSEVGLGDDLAVLHVWAAAAEELAERTVADVDVEELLLARTVGELAEAIMRALDPIERADFRTTR